MSLEQQYTAILGQLGEDVSREGLLDTPKRAAKAMQYLCHGYQQSLEEIVNGALFASDNDEMVIVKDIELYSLCEHHLLPFIGKAHVAYIPGNDGRVTGLSKLARLVDVLARSALLAERIAELMQLVEEVAFHRLDQRLAKLVGELSMRSDRFRELWASHNVRRHYAGRKSFRHPVVGLLEVNYVSLELTGDPGLVLTTYTATPGSPAEEALRLLASWAATERVAEQAGSRTESTVG